VYQCELALLEYLRHEDPGLDVSIEVLDDIALEGEQTELIQAKYHLKEAGSLSDMSPDLWKTLRVWSESATSQPNALLVLVTTATAGAGSIASLLRAADRDPTAAHQRLVNIAKSSSSQSLAPAMRAFVDLPDEDRVSLVDRILVNDGGPGFEDLDEQFRTALRLAVPSDRRDALAARLREWWLARTERHLVEVAQGTHPRISGTEIEGRLGDLRDELAADNLPIDFEELEPPGEEEVDEQRKFVMQLRLVALARPRVRKAVHDHNRAFHQRGRWLREDLVGFDELHRYEVRLKDEWERLWLPESNDELQQLSDEEAEDRGRGVFLACESAQVEPIRPKVSAPYVMRGTLHILADEMKIGWHHDWIERMQAVLEPGTP
jgi:hypothetical protein